MERKNVITFKGNPLTLVGPELKVGDAAPDFTATDAGLKPVKLSDFQGKTVVICSVPSLDTPVCATQTIKFNQEAGSLNAKVLTVSLDLPFAQKRFCESQKVQNVTVVSDYKDRDFAAKYGLLIKELGLLSRAVIVVNPSGKITYFEIVKEVTQEPNYQAAIDKVKNSAVAAAR
ncbi:MAG: thiol peroxidase [Candidatus Omnitrophota bacterium]